MRSYFLFKVSSTYLSTSSRWVAYLQHVGLKLIEVYCSNNPIFNSLASNLLLKQTLERSWRASNVSRLFVPPPNESSSVVCHC